jgi:hypothetical protein
LGPFGTRENEVEKAFFPGWGRVLRKMDLDGSPQNEGKRNLGERPGGFAPAFCRGPRDHARRRKVFPDPVPYSLFSMSGKAANA